jgi:hypothetical protein
MGSSVGLLTATRLCKVGVTLRGAVGELSGWCAPPSTRGRPLGKHERQRRQDDDRSFVRSRLVLAIAH